MVSDQTGGEELPAETSGTTEDIVPEAAEDQPETVIVKKLNVPFIVTLSILGVVIAAVAVVAVIYFVKKNRKKAENPSDDSENSQPGGEA